MKRPTRIRTSYNSKRNKLVVYLKKVKGWSYGEIRGALEFEFNHVINRSRVQQIYEDHQSKYSFRSFKGYEIPDTLARV